MKMLLVSIWTALLISHAADAQDSANGGLENTIQSQIDAFIVDDFDSAFQFASPNIQRLFGSPANFGKMVREGYPMVWRPSMVKFLELRRQGPFSLQKVLVRDANGAPHVLEYMMIETDTGWQIDGVQLLAAPPVGA